MKKKFISKMMITTAIFFVSIVTVSAQRNNEDNNGYDHDQGAYQDQRIQQTYSEIQRQQNDEQYTQIEPVCEQHYAQQNQYQTTTPFTHNQSFYYYPSANVYYDPAYNNYMYNNGVTWLTVNVLPYNISIGDLPKVMVYHRGPQVWLDNSFHRVNYYGYGGYHYHQPIVAYRGSSSYRESFYGDRSFVEGRRFGNYERPSYSSGRNFGGGFREGEGRNGHHH